MHAGSNRRLPEAHQTSLGCGNLVLAPSHTTLGETSVCTLQTIAKRASSAEICLAKSPLNLGQAPAGQQSVNGMKIVTFWA